MKTAIFAGAGVVNDITALTSDPGALEVVAGSESSVILMHMQGTPQNMQNAPNYRLASFDVCHWLNARVQACVDAGIVRGRIAIDPGIGFGKTDRHNTEILSRAAVLHGTGCAVALGVSRKSFIGRIGGIDDPRRRLSGTIGATLAALDRGVQIHRVHDVEEVQQAISIWSAIHDNA
jgi:dihydropteroate synthase